MKIQVNSDNTIAIRESLTHFVEHEGSSRLDRFASRLTRVEVHLSDVDNKKTGHEDKRCLVEVRPAGSQPRTASAQAAKMTSAVEEALGKMQRSLTTFFGRQGRTAGKVSAPASAAKKPAAKKTVKKKAVLDEKESPAPKKAAPEKPTKAVSHAPKKKRIYQARRKAWPTR